MKPNVLDLFNSLWETKRHGGRGFGPPKACSSYKIFEPLHISRLLLLYGGYNPEIKHGSFAKRVHPNEGNQRTVVVKGVMNWRSC